MSDSPQLQHHLPRFYLRAFGTSDRRVRLVERGTGASYTRAIKRALAEPDYYAFETEPGKVDRSTAEDLYGQLESLAAPIHKKLLNEEFPLNPQDHADFACALYWLGTRGEHFRQFFDRATDDLNRKILRTVARVPDGYMERKHAEWEANPTGPEPPRTLTPADRQALAAGEAFDIKPSRAHTIESSFVAMRDVTAIYQQMDWRFIAFPEPCLFTAEHPVICRRQTRHGEEYFGFGPIAAQEVAIALDPSHALVLTHPAPGKARVDAAYVGKRALAERLNWATLLCPASRVLVAHPEVTEHPLPVDS